MAAPTAAASAQAVTALPARTAALWPSTPPCSPKLTFCGIELLTHCPEAMSRLYKSANKLATILPVTRLNLTFRRPVEEVLRGANVLEVLRIVGDLVVAIRRARVPDEDTGELAGELLRNLRVRRQESAAARVANEHKLAAGERLEEAHERLLACVENGRRLGDVNGPHLERAEREVVEEVLDVGAR